MGAGAASLYVPRYVSEVSPISIRGGLATLNQASPSPLLALHLINHLAMENAPMQTHEPWSAHNCQLLTVTNIS